MNFSSNKITDIRLYYTQQLMLNFSNDESAQMLDMIFESLFGISRTFRLLNPELRLSESEMLKVHFAVKQLLKHRPVQYVLNESFFYGLSFFVDERVLIPRPETEELVDWILSNPQVTKGKPAVLDIGTGSGCIAISLKNKMPEASVWAIDISNDALAVARKNALQNQVEIHFVNDNIIAPTQTDHLPEFDVIVSNPPYVRESEKNQIKPNVLNYEPHHALFISDDDPLVFYKSIIRFCEIKLKKNGFLYFEINRAFGTQIHELLNNSGFSEIILKKDLSGNDRMFYARKS